MLYGKVDLRLVDNDNCNLDYLNGLSAQDRTMLNDLLTRKPNYPTRSPLIPVSGPFVRTKCHDGIVIVHAIPPYFEKIKIPLGAYTVGRTMFEADRFV